MINGRYVVLKVSIDYIKIWHTTHIHVKEMLSNIMFKSLFLALDQSLTKIIQ